MGVPAHDERDARFAAEHDIPVSHAELLSPSAAGQVGRPAVRYRLRDWLISRQRYWGPPIPIIHCPDCGPVAGSRQRPAGGAARRRGRSSGRHRPVTAGPGPRLGPRRLPRLRHRPGAGRPTSATRSSIPPGTSCATPRPSSTIDHGIPSAPARVLPVDFYAGGPEHVQRHHLYARFVTMALHDLGLVPFEEPFPRIRLGGVIVHHGAKMSKSRGNVVTPDHYIDAHGADVLRCALLFAAPWDQGGDFTDDGIVGIERFFARIRRTIASCDEADDDPIAVAKAIVACHRRDRTAGVQRRHRQTDGARCPPLALRRANAPSSSCSHPSPHTSPRSCGTNSARRSRCTPRNGPNRTTARSLPTSSRWSSR